MAYLIGADLGPYSDEYGTYYSDLTGTNLSQADLAYANLNERHAERLESEPGEPRGCALGWRHADRRELHRCRSARGELSGHTGLTAAQLYSTASYQAHDLTGITLGGNNLNLTGVNLAGQNLTNAGFSSARLTNANFSQANLAGADLSYATLTGADFSQANATNAAFGGATLTNANLSAAQLTGAQVATANFNGAGLTAAQIYSTASGRNGGASRQ